MSFALDIHGMVLDILLYILLDILLLLSLLLLLLLFILLLLKKLKNVSITRKKQYLLVIRSTTWYTK